MTHVAAQLDIDPSEWSAYVGSRARLVHQLEIRRRYGYLGFGEPPRHAAFLRFLWERAWTGDDRPGELLDHSTRWLVEHRVLLPGATTLARKVAQARERARRRAWRQVNRQLSGAQRARLERLLEVDAKTRLSELEGLRRPPRAPTIDGLVGALDRLDRLARLGGSRLDLAGLPAARQQKLAADATGSWAQTIERRGDARRLATLAAFACVAPAMACDDVIVVLLVVIGDLTSRAERTVQRDRARSQDDLDDAARLLAEVAAVVLDEQVPTAELRAAVFERVGGRELVRQAATTVHELVRGDGSAVGELLMRRYPAVRRFLSALVRTVPFAAATPDHPVLAALSHLRAVDEGRAVIAGAPREVVTEAWRPVALPDGIIDKRGWTLCVLDRLRAALRHRDVWTTAGRRWGDPRSLLIDAATWRRTGVQVRGALELPATAEGYLRRLAGELDTAYRNAAAALDEHPDLVWLERDHRRDRLHVARLDAIEEGESAVELRDHLHALLPRVDLPELLVEVDHLTGFSDEFTHLSGADTRPVDAALSVCAVLLAQACNVGWVPVVRADHPSLSQGRLEWIARNYVRPATVAAANARLVDYHATLPIVTHWGGGEMATADGMRFRVPVRSIATGANPRYWGQRHGVTYYTWASDQWTAFAGVVISGTLRDSQFFLDGLYANQTRVQPIGLTADTGAFSDVIHGLCRLLGYRFSPRLADIPDRRFWRLEKPVPATLARLARHRVNTALIAQHWDDLCRVAGTIHTRAVVPSDLIRAIQRHGQPTVLARAIAELGRIDHTIALLRYLTDDVHRRLVLTMLSRNEARHALARQIFHGRRGDLYQPYRTGQENQLGALGLVLNAIVLWNTRYLGAAVEHHRNHGGKVDVGDVGHNFALPPQPAGQLRPLRHP